MVDKFCDYLTKKIRIDNPEIDDEREEIINYGIHLIVGEIPKFFIIMGIAYLLGVFDLTILAYFLVLPYRAVSRRISLKNTYRMYCGVSCFLLWDWVIR